MESFLKTSQIKVGTKIWVNISKWLFVIYLSTISLNAQSYLTDAPEKWSEPEILRDYNGDIITGLSADVSYDGKQLFIVKYSTLMQASRMTEAGWSPPEALNSHINTGAEVASPLLSRDGKRLYWSASWAKIIYYSDWDEETNDWGPHYNAGSGLNIPGGYHYAEAMPDDSTMMITVGGNSYFSRWNKKHHYWEDAMPYPPPAGFFDSDLGYTFYKDETSKFYECENWGIGEFNGNIYVTYIYPEGSPIRSRQFHVNITHYSDSLYLKGAIQNRSEFYPSITGDGKTLYFCAYYTGSYIIYYCRLLEGLPLTTVKEETSYTLPEGFDLSLPYPNPFNSSFSYKVNVINKGNYKSEIFDITGKLIEAKTLGYLTEGEYLFNSKMKNTGSGVYLLKVSNGKINLTEKIVLLK